MKKSNIKKRSYCPEDFKLGDIVHWTGNVVTGLGFISDYELHVNGGVKNCIVTFFDGRYTRHLGDKELNYIGLNEADIVSGRLTKSRVSEEETALARDYVFKKLTHENRGRFTDKEALDKFLVELNSLCKKYRIVFDSLGSLPGYNMTKIDKKPVFVGKIGEDGAYMTAMYRVDI